jgi:hypothetical protein
MGQLRPYIVIETRYEGQNYATFANKNSGVSKTYGNRILAIKCLTLNG